MTPKEKIQNAVDQATMKQSIVNLETLYKEMKNVVDKLQHRVTIMFTLFVVLVGSSSDTGGEVFRKVLQGLLGG